MDDRKMKRLFQVIVRFFVVGVIEAFSLLAMNWLVPGITLMSSDETNILTVAMSAALVLAFLNGLVRPFLVLLTLPLNMFTLGIPTLVINGAMLLLTAHFLPYFDVDGWKAATLGTLILAAINTFLTSLTTIDDDYSFFEGAVQWLSKRHEVTGDAESGRGLVMLEIDGLSYPRMQRAIEQGLMPTVKKMLSDGTHALSAYDCGLPSQTSSAQAGIMYGDNFDIPAFRWYDKDIGKMVVSNNFGDAADLNARYAHGLGLMRNGSSINNLMAGDAEKTFLTLSVLRDSDEDQRRRRQQDLYLFWLNPNIFTRSIVLTLWDILVELYQGIRQRWRNIQPRMNRLHKGYPFLRAVTNVLLRDIGTFMVVMDVIQGVPSIYTTYVGYDEIAHHAGPDTPDAMNSLRALDTQLYRILEVIKRKAPRPYDVILLSDHGQSVGATFEQRYGYTLKEFIENLVEGKTSVADVGSIKSSESYTSALMTEIKGMEQNVALRRIYGSTIGRARKALQSRLEGGASPAPMEAEVIVCASGNLANVYFDLRAGKISMNELDEAHPGLLDALVAHHGVGFVAAYDEAGVPQVISVDGARNLQTGDVTGADPLSPYGDPHFRAEQLLRVAQFPHAGDLIVNSPQYPDGQVAAYEELVGSHGGMGGQQTDAFLFHPADMVVPPISNSAELFALLNARRGLPGKPLEPRPAPKKLESWSLETLLAGVRAGNVWGRRAVRALRLDRAVFREVATDPFSTGPALLIVLGMVAIQGLISGLNPDLPGTLLGKFAGQIFGGFIGWMFMVLLAHISGRLLSGEGNFTRTMRAMAFARTPQIIRVLSPLPFVGPLLSVAAVVIELVAMWIAVQEALGLKKLQAALIPIVGLLVIILTTLVIGVTFSGMALTVETILAGLGISAGP